MTGFASDYAALAHADRVAAAATALENVRSKHLKSAECWDRLAAVELELRQSRQTSSDQYGPEGK
jgi:hypothetical protein